MPALLYVGLGSNQGDKLKNVKQAIAFLTEDNDFKLLKVSSLYRTEPKDIDTKEWFINGAMCLETGLALKECLKKLSSLEQKIGREKKDKGQHLDRCLDLDILFYKDVIIKSRNLTVPHPKLHERRFVLQPLLDIAPDLVHPLLKRSVEELYEALEDSSKVIFLA